MSRMSMLLSGLAVLALAIGLVGCAGDQPQPSTPGPAAAPATPPAEEGSGSTEQPEGSETSAAPEGSGEAADPAIQEALAKLSDEDRALAEKQKICPVSDEPLGSMGVPIKLTVKDRDVFICCDGCKEAIEKSPDEYLAKLQ